MTHDELFTKVQEWATGEEVRFELSKNGKILRAWFTGEHGHFPVHLQCADDPLSVTFTAELPVRVAPGQHRLAALLVVETNLNLRLGAFHFEAKESRLFFRVSIEIHLPSHEGEGLSERIRFGFALAAAMLDNEFISLCAVATATPEVTRELAALDTAAQSKAGLSVSDTSTPRLN